MTKVPKIYERGLGSRPGRRQKLGGAGTEGSHREYGNGEDDRGSSGRIRLRAPRPSIGAELAVLHVDADLVLVTTTMARHPGTGMSPVWLDAASASVTGVTVRTEVLDEHPAAAAIATVMGSVPDPVLCMATHGWGAIRTSVLGSVGEDVVRTLGAPFLLVGPHAAADRGSTLEFTGPVVIGHDGSPAADAVLPAALEWARALETGILVVNAFHPLDVESACAPHRGHRACRRQAGAGGVNTGVRVVRSSFPAGEILEAAREVSASIIAMSTHGRTGLAQPLGSTTAAVLQSSRCPVLVTRPHKLP